MLNREQQKCVVAEYVEGKGRHAAKSTMLLKFMKLKDVFELEQPWHYHDYLTMLNDALNYAEGYAGKSNQPQMAKWLQMQIMGLRAYTKTQVSRQELEMMIDDIFTGLKSRWNLIQNQLNPTAWS